MTRHAMLNLAIGGLAALTLGAGHSARAQSDCAADPNALAAYRAGSLDATRRISVGQETADVFAAADYPDISLLL